MPDPTGPPDARPRGTLFIVGTFGLLVVAGWLLFFFGLFVPRITP